MRLFFEPKPEVVIRVILAMSKDDEKSDVLPEIQAIEGKLKLVQKKK